MLIVFKIFFSRFCKISDSWKDPIDDQDFIDEFKEFLMVLKSSYTSLRPWPRCLIPEGHSIRAIHCHTDGACYAACHVFYLVTAPIGKDLGCNQTQSWQCDAGSKIKGHRVPTNEATGLLQGVEEVAAFLYEHAEILLRHTTKQRLLTVSIGLDSSCLYSSLNPKMVH